MGEANEINESLGTEGATGPQKEQDNPTAAQIPNLDLEDSAAFLHKDGSVEIFGAPLLKPTDNFFRQYPFNVLVKQTVDETGVDLPRVLRIMAEELRGFSYTEDFPGVAEATEVMNAKIKDAKKLLPELIPYVRAKFAEATYERNGEPKQTKGGIATRENAPAPTYAFWRENRVRGETFLQKHGTMLGIEKAVPQGGTAQSVSEAIPEGRGGVNRTFLIRQQVK